MGSFVAKTAPPAGSYVSLGPVTADTTVNIRGVNRDLANALTIRLAVCPAALANGQVPANVDWILPPDLPVSAGGVVEETAIAVAAGEVVVVFSNSAQMTWRVHGR